MADYLKKVEIIEFVCPYRNEINLYVTNISKTISMEVVEVKLKNIFSKYGLIYEVQVFENEKSIGENCGSLGYYAFVKFYSKFSAISARNEINGKWFLCGQLLKVQFASRKKPHDVVYPLHMSKCVQLANHYFGYDGWCTSVVKMEECPKNQDTTTGSPQTMFTCTVRLEIRGCDCYCEGTGFGGDRNVVEKEENSVKKVQLIGYAKKLAHRHAFENAFKRVLIIATANGKVAVEINQFDVTDYSDISGCNGLQGTVHVNCVEETDVNTSDDENDSISGTGCAADDYL